MLCSIKGPFITNAKNIREKNNKYQRKKFARCE